MATKGISSLEKHARKLIGEFTTYTETFNDEWVYDFVNSQRKAFEFAERIAREIDEFHLHSTLSPHEPALGYVCEHYQELSQAIRDIKECDYDNDYEFGIVDDSEDGGDYDPNGIDSGYEY